ncbi:MAG: hypothetical protein A3H27_08405 [Acidobacteria bacterium RIFCSPLOWO2_02_FULL_59_13]|nr:MAG: hypothetical protein A3H27_08405 [Acidobacteria bacterium RIFCSPLOWO2_02_FULL_59_13]
MRGHVQGQIDDFLAERLSRRQQWLFQEHVDSCRTCQTALQQAQVARSYLQWLVPSEPPPQPGPAFYRRVQETIQQEQSSGWFRNWAAALHPHLAYPLVGLVVLLLAWTLTFPRQGLMEDSLMGMDFPASEFVQLSFSNADRGLGRDLVIRTLVDLPDAGFEQLALAE